MKIGIIVHSGTGNTFSVAQRLKERLSKDKHSVNIERISPVGGENTSERDESRIRLAAMPDVSQYDALIFASPVHGASISTVLKACLSRFGSLQNKKVSCLVTEFFPFPWMGGNQAVNQMKRICEAKSAVVCETGVINWKSFKREKQICEVVERFSRVFMKLWLHHSVN